MNQDIHAELSNQRYELDTMKDTVNKVLDSLGKNTEAMSALTTQFAVYASKHDTVEQELKDIKAKQDAHSDAIAEMRPTFNALRGFVWRIMGSIVIGLVGVAALVKGVG